MLLLLSPAKKLDYDSPVRTELHTQPQFVPQATALITVLRNLSVDDVAQLMKLSNALAELNVQRYAEWQPEFTPAQARQAILAFNGDVYEGLQASELSDDQLRWAQSHLAILSGLYGVLRPLDLMRPYRLEMGTRLSTSRGNTLYAFWGAQIAQYLNECVGQLVADQGESPVILNLASEEYFKSVDLKTLKARVIQCVFQDAKNDQWKIISFHAKRARGLMARYVIDHRITDPARLVDFASEGYVYAPEVSTADSYVFRRASS